MIVREDGMIDARRDDVVDDYHGTAVADPYRWLEDPASDETGAWTEAQQAATARYLAAIPGREKIKARLTRLWDYPKYSVPVKRGGRYFFSMNSGLQNQAVLYMQEGLDGALRVVLDPNTLSVDGTVALTNQAFSRDGTLLAYGVSGSGSDWQEIRVRRVDAGTDDDETIRWCKFSSIAWRHDNSGFYYNRYPAPGTVAPEDENSYNAGGVRRPQSRLVTRGGARRSRRRQAHGQGHRGGRRHRRLPVRPVRYDVDGRRRWLGPISQSRRDPRAVRCVRLLHHAVNFSWRAGGSHAVWYDTAPVFRTLPAVLTRSRLGSINEKRNKNEKPN